MTIQLKRPPVYDRQKSRKQPITKTVTVYLDDEAQEAVNRANRDLAAAEAARASQESILARLEAIPAAPERLAEAATTVEAARVEVTRAEEAVQAVLDDLMTEHAASFRLVSIGRKRYDRLVLEHPPTEEQNAEHQQEFGSNAPYNAETFPPALLMEVCVEPRMELWEWKSIFDWDLLTDDEVWLAVQALHLENVEGDRDTVIELLRAEQPEWNMSELVEITTSAIEVCTHRRVVDLGKAYG